MVSLVEVQASNARIASSLPEGLVAVFVGATNGIGETSLKQFATHTIKPRVYFVGRSQEAGDRIAAECKALNSEGEFTFVKADVSLMSVVDDVCRDITSKEKAINLLFLCQGTLVSGKEGLHLPLALAYYSRTRFILNLLPLIQQASGLRRVVSVFTGTKEGKIDTKDYEGWKAKPLSARGHASSMVTLSFETIAKKAPEVSFIHDFPGPVKSGITRGTTGFAMGLMKTVFAIVGPFVYIANKESGERHLFCATSAMYPASSQDTAAGVPCADGIAVARGTNGKTASGVYSIDWDGTSAGPKVEELLAKFRTEGLGDQVWKHTEEQFNRIASLPK